MRQLLTRFLATTRGSVGSLAGLSERVSLILFLLIMLIPVYGFAQKPQRLSPPGSAQPARRAQAEQMQKSDTQTVGNQQRVDLMRRVRELPPEEQEQYLAHDKLFQSASPERQQQFLENLRRWNAMTPEQKERVRQFQANAGNMAPGQNVRGLMMRIREMPPDEQERFLAQNKLFQSAPPELQQRFRENLRKWNAMTPAQKEDVRQRQALFERMSPAQREEARATFRQWTAIDPERRQAIRQIFRQILQLSGNQRQSYLASAEVQQRLTPQERDILSHMIHFLPDTVNAPPPPSE